jgi:hypothetical protein
MVNYPLLTLNPPPWLEKVLSGAKSAYPTIEDRMRFAIELSGSMWRMERAGRCSGVRHERRVFVRARCQSSFKQLFGSPCGDHGIDPCQQKGVFLI